jgi:hypothetical protein
MGGGEILFLAIVMVAFVAFAATLAYYSRG